MHRPILAVVLIFLPVVKTLAQSPATPQGDSALPAPGARGNADNVPYIGRSDPNGNPVRLARATGHVSNYSEEKVLPYTLPDPLLMANGERVASAEMWFTQRRGEILKFYQSEIYGRVPANAPQVTWEVTETTTNAREGKAIMKRVVGTMGDRPDGPRMNLTVYLPAKAEGPVPLLLSFTFAFGARSGQPAAGGAAPLPRPAGGFDSVGEVLSRGWGYASLGYTDIQPDRADRWIGRGHRTHAAGRPVPASRRRMGHDQRLGLGHQPGDRLPRDRHGRQREASRHHRRFAAWARRSFGPPPRTSAWPPCSRWSPARWAPP